MCFLLHTHAFPNRFVSRPSYMYPIFTPPPSQHLIYAPYLDPIYPPTPPLQSSYLYPIYPSFSTFTIHHICTLSIYPPSFSTFTIHHLSPIYPPSFSTFTIHHLSPIYPPSFSTCSRVSGALAKRYGNTGFQGRLSFDLTGAAGQSFCAFLSQGRDRTVDWMQYHTSPYITFYDFISIF